MPNLRMILAGLIAATAASGSDPFPPPHNTEPDKDAAPPAPQDALGRWQVPDGFGVTLFAAEPDVQNPIAMAWDHRGRMWVAENFTYAESGTRFDLSLRDRILVFDDADGDGRADSRTVFTDDLQMLTSVELGRGGVWAMCPPQLLFIPDHDGDDVPDGAPEVKLDGFEVAKGNYHNFANGLRWGPDGWLYGRCGHSCPGKLGKPGTPGPLRVPIKGGIWRYHPERETVEVLCHGTVNPWGHDWDRHGELFFVNTVIGHLWHGIPGAHFKESSGATPNPDVFERIGSHADHWHFDTKGSWTESRDGKADAFGGGHAHTGAMIYQADQWPAGWQGKLFTLNMHGFRTNVESLERVGSSYLARHHGDAFPTSDPWFRGTDIRQGPCGSAFVLDWSDTGECHEHSGIHRTSGRIYRISHGQPEKPPLADLHNLHPDAVRRLLRHPNVWFERKTRNQLASDHAAGRDVAPARAVLAQALSNESDPVLQLRALWTLHATGGAGLDTLRRLLGHPNEHLRSWAVRLLTDDRPIDTILGPREGAPPAPLGAADLERLRAMAETERSGLVRLALASGLQRLPLDQRAGIAAALVARAEDAADHNLPFLVYFGLIPLADSDPGALMAVAEACRWPAALRSIARAVATRTDLSPGATDRLVRLAARAGTPLRTAVLEGISAGLEGRQQVQQPASWGELVAAVGEHPDKTTHTLVRDLSTLFGDGRALEMVRKTALDPHAHAAARISAVGSLVDNRPPDLREICESLLDTPGLNAAALRGLATFDDPELGQTIAANYDKFAPAHRPGVVETLVTRPSWAKALLGQIGAGKIPRPDLSAFHARQIRAFGNDALTAKLAECWGGVRETTGDKRTAIAGLQAQLTPARLADADLRRGRALYERTCAACHVLYGEGGTTGPDLTGSGRHDLGYLLENIIDPGAVVSADHQVTVLTLDDGRKLAGTVRAENAGTLTLQQPEASLTVAAGAVVHRETLPQSMMPEGLLAPLTPDETRDLIAYLKHPTQVPRHDGGAGQP